MLVHIYSVHETNKIIKKLYYRQFLIRTQFFSESGLLKSVRYIHTNSNNRTSEAIISLLKIQYKNINNPLF